MIKTIDQCSEEYKTLVSEEIGVVLEQLEQYKSLYEKIQ